MVETASIKPIKKFCSGCGASEYAGVKCACQKWCAWCGRLKAECLEDKNSTCPRDNTENPKKIVFLSDGIADSAGDRAHQSPLNEVMSFFCMVGVTEEELRGFNKGPKCLKDAERIMEIIKGG